MTRPIIVTVHDPESGETDTREVQPGGYVVIACAPCHHTETQADLEAGTHTITVKGVRRGR
ncbi:hypothetical protein ACU635_50840 [[Actinomadura] parvosata]|uniref:hypothetical protein n=1 Tax=[Actinomadura] parvosata TaxID=1955412 RepID=UPI00406C5EA7